MKKTVLAKALGVTLGVALMTACASKDELSAGDATEVQPLEAAQQDTQTTAVTSQPVVGEQVDATMTEAQAALLDVTTFYFAFDQSTIKRSSKASLVAHAKYLAANSSARIVLEGHADERGSVEYNLALGERRALSVSRFLQSKGARASQIETVSFGEERPVVMGHSSDTLSQNRRVELKYQYQGR